jgi:hypothetical protein
MAGPLNFPQTFLSLYLKLLTPKAATDTGTAGIAGAAGAGKLSLKALCSDVT